MNFPLKMMVCIFLILPQLIEAQSTINLFNKKNLDGWYAYQVESGKHKHASDLFNVEHHIIRLYGKNAGYLMSEQSFSNFKLTVTFRWNIDPSVIRKSDKKNSGVMYLVPFEAPDMLWPKGIQFQIKEGATGDFILLQDTTLKINGTRTEPGRSVVSKRFEDASKPIGKWNTMVVTVSNGIVTQELNGKLVNKGVEPSITEGRILLQYEGYPIDFKKVVVRRLKP
ncbi:hypothetical protein GCM10007962_09140 [Yeosuana aromativorans]|uniref:3-keto-alpha-glucoside-1,2-lyase/3-keto-2-hydroxy-glucal hydratase domain-containing protein n=2 Tax=Yeosuana aromativorans TaxID=288019 RepID=A0A8J3BF85_9FLAO|nr:hypothetical protein GCM10007962_09140 [Yeosuana aromativorans]